MPAFRSRARDRLHATLHADRVAIPSEEHHPSDAKSIIPAPRPPRQTGGGSGLTFALISDHYHPWIDAQGHSPFVWSVIGGIAAATEKVQLGTRVTCPTVRIHPAIVAQAPYYGVIG